MGAEDKRRCERVRYDGIFEYALSVPDLWEPRIVEAVGSVVDICRHGEGVGFFTDFPLEPGHVIRLAGDDSGMRPAVVKWAEKIENRHRVGIFLFGNRRES